MAKKSGLNTATLVLLGARRLAELLIDATSHDAAAQRVLRLEIAAAESPKAAAIEIRKRLTALAHSRTFVRRSRAGRLARELDTQREAIETFVAGCDPKLAVDVLWRFMSVADRVLQRCDDSDGLVGDVFRRARADLGRATEAARSDPVKLSGKVFEALLSNTLGQYDGLIGELAPALGETGLDHLRRKVLAFRDSRGGAASDAAPSNVVAGPWAAGDADNGGRRDVSYLLKYTVPQALTDIADAQGDVDAFVAQFDQQRRTIPVFAAEIAQRLLAANRAEEALEILQEADHATDSGPHLRKEWSDARIAVLDALGRSAEAQANRWMDFESRLDSERLSAYLKRLPASEKEAATETALACAADYHDVHKALAFLLAWPDLPGAAALIVRRARELNGGLYGTLNAAVSSLASDHPLAATLALRALMDFTLGNARSTRYGHAARQLLECTGLAQRIGDYRGFHSHDEYLANLLETHDRKTKFWGLVGDLVGDGTDVSRSR